jgi:hypothetical protein
MFAHFFDAQRLRAAEPFLILAALPLVLLAFNGSWLWDSPYYHDSNVYIGFFRHYLEFTPPYIENYKLSRLPFVLPGVLLYALFPAGVAHHVLHLVFLIAEAWLVFALARRRFGAHAAFVAAAAVLVFTFSHTLPSYHNQAASTYFVAALALLELPAHWPAARRTLLAGALFALAVTTDTIVGTMLPVLALRAVVVTEAPRTPVRLALQAAYGLAGVLAAFAVLGAANAALGGPFLFFVEQLKYSLGMAKAHSMSDLGVFAMLKRYGEFPQLTFPLAATGAAFALLVTRVVRRRWDFAALEALCLVIAMVIAALQQQAGLKMIEEPCLFHPFFAPVFMTLPALFTWGTRGAADAGRPFLVAVSALLLVPLVFFGEWCSRFVLDAQRAWPSMVYGVPLALLLAGLACVAATRWPGVAAKMGIFGGAFGIMNALSTAPSQPAQLYQAGADCAFRREAFYAVLRADALLAKFDPRSEARWKSVGLRLEHPAFDGTGWCSQLPIETVARDVLLSRYFYTSDELLYGARVPPLKKIVLAANTRAQLDALRADVWSGVPAQAKTTTAFERELKYSTFSVFLGAYDIALPLATARP